MSVLRGEAVWPPPVWLMRQAGRYLPEYRELRAKTGSFLTMAMTPEIAQEITLQPIRRFGFDAAVLFSDILVVPIALGFTVTFDEGTGPRVSLGDEEDGKGLEMRPKIWAEKLAPVYESIGLVKAKLDGQTALLGFAGAPWTLASYMAKGAGKGSEDQRAAKLWGYRDPEGFGKFLTVIGECVAFHLIRQLEAGADVVQIFDSWAGSLTAEAFADWVITPTRRIVERVRSVYPDAPIIGFPRATTLQGYERYAKETGVTAISVDTTAPIGWARDLTLPVQGNLDPLALIAGGDALTSATDRILETMRGRPFIFNLGHGVLPQTPPQHVGELVARIRAAW
ncbi:MAG TPA: uroporphyrinogen decarboxylase [Rhizomicrobium sp.]